MNCFQHADRSAVGVCRACGKALCRDCLVEVEGGIACRDTCEEQVAAMPRGGAVVGYRSIRRRSSVTVYGLPLVDIAIGPDPTTGRLRGHACGIIAIGDTARGVLAIGGVSCGVISLGGCAFGGLALGGCAIGLVALGGAAVGIVAAGGAACGYYAIGGGAAGKHVLSGARQDPALQELFQRLLSFFTG